MSCLTHVDKLRSYLSNNVCFSTCARLSAYSFTCIHTGTICEIL